MSTGQPPRWTGMTARVRSVSTAPTVTAVMLLLSMSISADHRPGSDRNDRTRRRDEGAARDDHVVARTDAECSQSKLKR